MTFRKSLIFECQPGDRRYIGMGHTSSVGDFASVQRDKVHYRAPRDTYISLSINAVNVLWKKKGWMSEWITEQTIPEALCGAGHASEKNRSIGNSENHKNSKLHHQRELSVCILSWKYSPVSMSLTTYISGQPQQVKPKDQTQVSLRSDHLGKLALRWPPSPHIPACAILSHISPGLPLWPFVICRSDAISFCKIMKDCSFSLGLSSWFILGEAMS